MDLRQSKPALAFVAVVPATALALLTVYAEHTGPASAGYGNLCGASNNEPCLQPVLKGGFPLPYLYDTPGVSVEHQLSFGEDTLHPIALMLDIAVGYAAIFPLLLAIISRGPQVRARDTRREGAGDRWSYHSAHKGGYWRANKPGSTASSDRR